MENLRIGNLSKEEIYILIKDRILGSKIGVMKPYDANDLYHNSSYKVMRDVLRCGVLSVNEMYRLGIRENNNQGIDNVNGTDSISISKVEDYNPKKDFYYDSKSEHFTRIVVDKSLYNVRNICRNSHNYCNEYLVKDSIPVEYFKAIEERLLGYLLQTGKGKYSPTLDQFIEMYNHYMDMLEYMVTNNIDIPVVSGSLDEDIIIDKEKMLSYGKLSR